MSRGSSLFMFGIFIIFLAILFHYFCRTKKKPEMIVQQQIVPGEGYVYPITPNDMMGHHQSQVVMGGQNHAQLYPAMPLPYPVAPGGGQYGYPYAYPHPNIVGGGVGMGGAQNQNPANSQTNHSQPAPPNVNQPHEDLPPPYHVAVGATASNHPQ